MKRTFALLLALAMLPGSAWAQWKPAPTGGPAPSKAATDEARERFKKGLKLYEDEGAVEAALIELQRAYDLAPRYQVLYNIGVVARSHRDFVTALRAFERYLSDGGKEIANARRNEVEKELDNLRGLIATVEISVNTEGATVTLDELTLGKSPLTDPVLMNAGRRKLTATKEALTATKYVTLAGGDKIKVELELTEPKAATPVPVTPVPSTQPTTTAEPTPSPKPEPPPPAPPQRSYAWVGLAATGVLAAAAGVTGAIALSASSDLKDMRYAGSSPSQAVDDQQSKVKTLAIATDILMGTAVVALGLTLVIYVSESSSSKSGATSSTPSARPALPSSVAVRVGPRSAALTGSF